MVVWSWLEGGGWPPPGCESASYSLNVGSGVVCVPPGWVCVSLMPYVVVMVPPRALRRGLDRPFEWWCYAMFLCLTLMTYPTQPRYTFLLDSCPSSISMTGAGLLLESLSPRSVISKMRSWLSSVGVAGSVAIGRACP